MPGLINWSVDAASNDVADPPILWQEGQPAATVNNSNRAMMASGARWRDDNGGTLTATRGPGDAYSVATSQTFSGAASSQAHTLTFRPNAANQGPATLALDGNAAWPIHRNFGRVLAPGDLSAACVYVVCYVPAFGAYRILSPYIDRPGAIRMQGDATPDGGWLPCDGSAVSRISYVALFERIGATYGAGDGSTTFNLPNLNGRAPFGPGLSGVGGIGGTLGSTGGSETVSLTGDHLPSHTHPGSTAGAGAHNHGGSTGNAGSHNHGALTGGAGEHAHSATASLEGLHTHSGTTDVAGSHGHPISYDVGSAGSGASNRVVRDLQPNGILNAGGATSLSGDHQHDFSTASAGNHGHTLTVNSVGNHAHAIATVGDHAHSISAVVDHTHDVTVGAAGGNQAHPNMPPALVVAFAIKA